MMTFALKPRLQHFLRAAVLDDPVHQDEPGF
jgi:hypothetical protein